MKALATESVMTMFQPISTVSDRVMNALVAGLELEFGRGAAEALADRFIAAEESDFCWDARIEERWLSAYATEIEDDFELDRVAVVGRLDGRWFVAVILVDGDEMAHGMMGKRTFPTRKAAHLAYQQMR